MVDERAIVLYSIHHPSCVPLRQPLRAASQSLSLLNHVPVAAKRPSPRQPPTGGSPPCLTRASGARLHHTTSHRITACHSWPSNHQLRSRAASFRRPACPLPPRRPRPLEQQAASRIPAGAPSHRAATRRTWSAATPMSGCSTCLVATSRSLAAMTETTASWASTAPASCAGSSTPLPMSCGYRARVSRAKRP